MSRPSDEDIQQESLWEISSALDDIRVLLAFIAKDIWDKNMATVTIKPSISSAAVCICAEDYHIYTDVIKRVLGIGKE